VTTVDGSRCGTVGEGFVRVNLATPRPVVLDIARRISDALAV
jgi:cystathionine beta-lyase